LPSARDERAGLESVPIAQHAFKKRIVSFELGIIIYIVQPSQMSGSLRVGHLIAMYATPKRAQQTIHSVFDIAMCSIFHVHEILTMIEQVLLEGPGAPDKLQLFV
jgi:hypothetical protein